MVDFMENPNKKWRMTGGYPYFGNLHGRIQVIQIMLILPSGKLIVCYGEKQSLIGKSTINVPFSIAMLNYPRVY